MAVGMETSMYVDTPKRFPEPGDHWDLEFVFRGETDAHEIPKPSSWTEMKFIDLESTSRTEMARSHEDILESLGFRFGKS